MLKNLSPKTILVANIILSLTTVAIASWSAYNSYFKEEGPAFLLGEEVVVVGPSAYHGCSGTVDSQSTESTINVSLDWCPVVGDVNGHSIIVMGNFEDFKRKETK